MLTPPMNRTNDSLSTCFFYMPETLLLVKTTVNDPRNVRLDTQVVRRLFLFFLLSLLL